MDNENLILETVLKIVNNGSVDFHVTSEHIHLKLIELGLDSVTEIYIILCIEKTFDIEIPDSYLISGRINNINDMVNVINELIKLK